MKIHDETAWERKKLLMSPAFSGVSPSAHLPDLPAQVTYADPETEARLGADGNNMKQHNVSW